MLIEFLLGLAQNVTSFLWYVSFLFAVISILSLIVWFAVSTDVGTSEKDAKEARMITMRIFRFAFPMFLVAFLISSLPKVDDLWKIRVSLIKFHLASPENIKAGADAIERIGHKLECQYLGCKEDKQPEKKEEENKD